MYAALQRGDVADEGSATQLPQRTKDLRLELTVKNNVLWRAIHDRHASIAEFCRAHKELASRYSAICGLLRFNLSPYKKTIGEYRKVCLLLERILETPAEDLFPPCLYAHFLVHPETKKVLEVDSFTALPGAVRQQIRFLPAPAEDLLQSIEAEELKEQLVKVLKTLSHREREIIKLRYGLTDGHQYTLEEVAHIFKVTCMRVRQIEAKAIRKLQQPSRAAILAAFAQPE